MDQKEGDTAGPTVATLTTVNLTSEDGDDDGDDDTEEEEEQEDDDEDFLTLCSENEYYYLDHEEDPIDRAAREAAASLNSLYSTYESKQITTGTWLGSSKSGSERREGESRLRQRRIVARVEESSSSGPSEECSKVERGTGKTEATMRNKRNHPEKKGSITARSTVKSERRHSGKETQRRMACRRERAVPDRVEKEAGGDDGLLLGEISNARHSKNSSHSVIPRLDANRTKRELQPIGESTSKSAEVTSEASTLGGDSDRPRAAMEQRIEKAAKGHVDDNCGVKGGRGPKGAPLQRQCKVEGCVRYKVSKFNGYCTQCYRRTHRHENGGDDNDGTVASVTSGGKMSIIHDVDDREEASSSDAAAAVGAPSLIGSSLAANLLDPPVISVNRTGQSDLAKTQVVNTKAARQQLRERDCNFATHQIIAQTKAAKGKCVGPSRSSSMEQSKKGEIEKNGVLEKSDEEQMNQQKNKSDGHRSLSLQDFDVCKEKENKIRAEKRKNSEIYAQPSGIEGSMNEGGGDGGLKGAPPSRKCKVEGCIKYRIAKCNGFCTNCYKKTCCHDSGDVADDDGTVTSVSLGGKMLVCQGGACHGEASAGTATAVGVQPLIQSPPADNPPSKPVASGHPHNQSDSKVTDMEGADRQPQELDCNFIDHQSIIADMNEAKQTYIDYSRSLAMEQLEQLKKDEREGEKLSDKKEEEKRKNKEQNITDGSMIVLPQGSDVNAVQVGHDATLLTVDALRELEIFASACVGAIFGNKMTRTKNARFRKALTEKALKRSTKRKTPSTNATNEPESMKEEQSDVKNPNLSGKTEPQRQRDLEPDEAIEPSRQITPRVSTIEQEFMPSLSTSLEAIIKDDRGRKHKKIKVTVKLHSMPSRGDSNQEQCMGSADNKEFGRKKKVLEVEPVVEEQMECSPSQTPDLSEANAEDETDGKFQANERIFAWDKGHLYKAHIVKCKKCVNGSMKYQVHYLGFKQAHDKWLCESDVVKDTPNTREFYEDCMTWPPEKDQEVEDNSKCQKESTGRDENRLLDRKRRTLETEPEPTNCEKPNILEGKAEDETKQTFSANERIFAWDKGHLYKAHVVKCKIWSNGHIKYFVHYLGFKRSHDKWLTMHEMIKYTPEACRFYEECTSWPLEDDEKAKGADS